MNVFSVSQSGLSYAYSPNPGGLSTNQLDKLSAVAFANSGSRIAAGGSLRNGDGKGLRLWRAADSYVDLKLSGKDVLNQLVPFAHWESDSDSGFLYAKMDNGFGAIREDGKPVLVQHRITADYEPGNRSLAVGSDGSFVQCRLERSRDWALRFDVERRSIEWTMTNVAAAKVLSYSRIKMDNVNTVNWINNPEPRWKEKKLDIGNGGDKRIGVRCWSIAEDGQSFVVGTDNRLLCYAGNGEMIWSDGIPRALSVVLSGDGKMVVAALEDGTIRWFNKQDGSEKMAFFPYIEEQNSAGQGGR